MPKKPKSEIYQMDGDWISVSKAQPLLGITCLVKFRRPHPGDGSMLALDRRRYDDFNGQEDWGYKGQVGWWMPVEWAGELLADSHSHYVEGSYVSYMPGGMEEYRAKLRKLRE